MQAEHCVWKAPTRDKAGNTGSSVPGLWQEAIQPDSSGAEFGAQGCEGAPQEEKRGHWGGRPLLPPCPLRTSIGCGHSCPPELQDCCVEETPVQV